jgi:hypothetical protein
MNRTPSINPPRKDREVNVATRKPGLSDDQRATLDAAYTARFKEDRNELKRLVNILPLRERPQGCVTKVTTFAELVAERLGIGSDGVVRRLYGNGIAKDIANRELFMRAVEEVLRDQYSKLGYPFEHDYQIFVGSVDDDDGGDANDWAPHGGFAKWAYLRVGAFLADPADPEHVDAVHHYKEIFRQDMLDYATGDFYSIRRLKGRNMSRRPSHFVLYRESSERMFTFNDTQVKALDCASREQLWVEPELGFETRAHTHAFRIQLPKPIDPGQGFDIAYRIRLPGELADLSPDSEVMSISLTRIALGIDKLVFNVALSMKPRVAVPYRLTQAKTLVPCAGKGPKVVPYEPKYWFEHPDQLGIEWSVETPYIVRWSIASPRDRMYVIHFRNEPAYGQE